MEIDLAKRVGVLPGLLDIATSTMTNVTLPEGFSQSRDHCGSVLLAPAQDQRVMILGGGDPAINTAHHRSESSRAGL